MLSKPYKPGLPYFTPDKRQGLLIGNFDYSAIRVPGEGVDDEGKPIEKGFSDLPEVQQDIIDFNQNLQRYSFDGDMNIIQKINVSVAEIKKIC